MTEIIDEFGGGHHVVESYFDAVIGPPVPAERLLDAVRARR